MRLFWLTFLAFASLSGGACLAAGGEMLYNGIQLPQSWPPRLAEYPDEPVTPPYLLSPPGVIPIDVGRQLFVDDFLIEHTNLRRVYHQAEYHPATPVVKPDQPWESWGRGPMATVFSDGVWYDPKDNLFKMWYYGGHGGGTTCYAVSKDGVHWEKPKLDVVPGTNIVYKGPRDSGTVWLDYRPRNPDERFKMALYAGGRMILFRSPDGIHWTKVLEGCKTGDRSTFFYNPFRQRWVFSIRSSGKRGRSREYWEGTDFFGFTDEVRSRGEVVKWVCSDTADPMRDDLKTPCQLYNLDCVAYESIMIGLFTIWRGDYRGKPQNEKWAELQRLGRPKQNSVCIGFSRDGFHWYRPDRRPFCPTSEKMGDWNWGNMQSCSNCCLVVGDKLYFYVSGRAGRSFPGNTNIDAGGSTGLALLRRDGFASMWTEGEGVLTTRPVRFSGKYLFVNLQAEQGELRAELLDEQGNPIVPFTKANCVPVSGDKTRVQVTWKGAESFASLSGRRVKFRFHLRNGALYSFWVSPDTNGASHGYVAGGGPGFIGPTDTVGK